MKPFIAANEGDRQLRPQTHTRYYELQPLFEQLCSEVGFVISRRLRNRRVEVAHLTSRVKSLKSLLDKAERKNYSNIFGEASDIAGVRVVCLYKDDLPRIAKWIREDFNVLEHDDKRPDAVDQFGYDALHFVVQLRRQVSGARFQDLRSLRCEIQVRTVLQDAWAIIDHHLRYKKETQIPSNLRRSIHSLAAMLENADSQFNTILSERDKYRRRLMDPRRSLKSLLPEEVNRESLRAYLNKRFPDKAFEGHDKHYTQVLGILDLKKYGTLAQIEDALSATERIRGQYQRAEYSKTALSHLAIALACVDKDYRNKIVSSFGSKAQAVVVKYQALRRRKLQKQKSIARAARTTPQTQSSEKWPNHALQRTATGVELESLGRQASTP